MSVRRRETDTQDDILDMPSSVTMESGNVQQKATKVVRPGKPEGCETVGRILVKYHCVLFFFFFVLIFAVTAIAGTVDGGIKLSGQSNNDFTVNDNQAAIDLDAVNNANSRTDSTSSVVKKAKPRQTPNLSRGSWNIMFSSKDSGDVFTPENVQEMCKIEKMFFDHPKYAEYCVLEYLPNGTASGCAPPILSVAHMFYAAKYTACANQAQCDAINGMMGNIGAVVDDGATPTATQYVVNSMAPVRVKFSFDECALLPKWKVDAVRTWVYKLASTKTVALQGLTYTGEQLIGFYLDVNTLKESPVRSVRTRSMLSIGTPLNGFTDEKDRPKEQKDLYTAYFNTLEEELWANFGMKKAFLRSAYRDEAYTEDMKIEWFSIAMMNGEFGRMLDEDFLAPIGSILFVFCWIQVHTRSIFVGSLGMLQILLSLPFAYTIYRFIFGIRAFSQMHILAIFLVLGVGADDIFVLTDAWKQSKYDVKREEEDDDNAFYARRMAFAYSRTSKAVFNTSFTTAMAFVSTGISPMMSISTFGWFATIAIAVNYLFVITFTPCVILVAEKWVHPFFRARLCRKARTSSGNDGASIDSDASNREDAVDRCLSKCYVPCILKQAKPGSRIYPIAIVSVLAFLGYAIFGILATIQLTPPTKAEQWFPLDHMMTGLTDRMTDNYMGGSDDGYVTMSWVFGIEGLDRVDFDKYLPDENRGIATFDKEFDIYPEINQQALLQLCQSMQTLQCEVGDTFLDGCQDQTNHRLVRAGTLVCFMKEFRDWHSWTHGVVPNEANGVTKAQFLDRLKSFRADTKPGNNTQASWKTIIGIIGGELKYVRIPFTSTVVRLAPVLSKEPVHALVQEEVKKTKADMPIGLKTLFQEAGYYGWVWMVTQRQLVTSMMTGMAICFPIALGVLLVATGNVLVSLYATVSIGCIVCCVLGFTRSFMNWDLGIAESIAGIIVIGFSVDYVVHLAHMFMEGRDQGGFDDRESRVRFAATKMGGTVVGGAVTTAGSGAVMWFCQMTFFTKMAVLITMTILFSILFSLFFFLPALVIMGPNGAFANIPGIASSGSRGGVEDALGGIGGNIKVIPVDGPGVNNSNNYALPDEEEENAVDDSKNYELPEEEEEVADPK